MKIYNVPPYYFLLNPTNIFYKFKNYPIKAIFTHKVLCVLNLLQSDFIEYQIFCKPFVESYKRIIFHIQTIKKG